MSNESAVTEGKGANKGEWSELYAFLKLLSEGRLYAADKELERIESIFYPILSVIREDVKGEVYKYRTSDVAGNIRIYSDNKLSLSLPVSEFRHQADSLLRQIQKGSGAFHTEKSTSSFLQKIFIRSIKAPSCDKADIVLHLHDINTGFEPKVPFSIKSQLGSASTLLNAGRTTNFIYSVKGLTQKDIDEVNAIYTIRNEKAHADVMKRVKTILSKGGNIVFCDMENKTFKDNLFLIDSRMPELLAEMLLLFYEPHKMQKPKHSHCVALTESISEVNPLKVSNELFYEYKVMDFLSAVALGMKPATMWDGLDEANGGYIVVKKDGEVLTYHLYNRNAFKSYLLNNTKFETASTIRHNYGYLYEQDQDVLLKLNLQIRFI